MATKKTKYCMYIGPDIRGYISRGQIIVGDIYTAQKEAYRAIEKEPLVKSLIVPDELISTARLDVKKPGTAYHTIYRQIEKNLKKEN